MDYAKYIRRKYAIQRYYRNKTLKNLKKDDEPSGEHDYRRGQNGNRGNYRGRGDRRGGRGDHRGRGRRGRGGRGRGGIIQDGYMNKDGDDDRDNRDRRTGQFTCLIHSIIQKRGYRTRSLVQGRRSYRTAYLSPIGIIVIIAVE